MSRLLAGWVEILAILPEGRLGEAGWVGDNWLEDCARLFCGCVELPTSEDETRPDDDNALTGVGLGAEVPETLLTRELEVPGRAVDWMLATDDSTGVDCWLKVTG